MNGLPGQGEVQTGFFIVCGFRFHDFKGQLARLNLRVLFELGHFLVDISHEFFSGIETNGLKFEIHNVLLFLNKGFEIRYCLPEEYTLKD